MLQYYRILLIVAKRRRSTPSPSIPNNPNSLCILMKTIKRAIRFGRFFPPPFTVSIRPGILPVRASSSLVISRGVDPHPGHSSFDRLSIILVDQSIRKPSPHVRSSARITTHTASKKGGGCLGGPEMGEGTSRGLDPLSSA